MSNQVLTQVQQLKNYINKEIIRQDTLVERILIALLADGLHSSCKIQKKLCFLHQRRDKAGLVSTRKFIQFCSFVAWVRFFCRAKKRNPTTYQ